MFADPTYVPVQAEDSRSGKSRAGSRARSRSSPVKRHSNQGCDCGPIIERRCLARPSNPSRRSSRCPRRVRLIASKADDSGPLRNKIGRRRVHAFHPTPCHRMKLSTNDDCRMRPVRPAMEDRAIQLLITSISTSLGPGQILRL